MKLFLAADHTGFALKETMRVFLQEKGYTVVDCGAHVFDSDDDYPEYMYKAATGVGNDPHNNRGIIFGGSGQGEAMVANKVKGVRCALFYSKAVPTQAINIEGAKSEDPFAIVGLTREHNGANMLSIGVRFLSEADIKKAILMWLDAPNPYNERHIRRIEQIKELEKLCMK